MKNYQLPAIYDGNINNYLSFISKIKILSQDEEQDLALRWYKNKDIEAANQLIISHLPLVVKVAYSFKGYKIPLGDLISEGTVGLMRSLTNFEPEKGYRLATYANWWIKAYITDYIINSWSMVKFGTLNARKKLFFSLRKLKSKLGIQGDDLTKESIKIISNEAGVKDQDVIDLNNMLYHKDVSLDTKISNEGNSSLGDFLKIENQTPEEELAQKQTDNINQGLVRLALESFNEREKYIITRRYLLEKPSSLQEIGEELNISRERVRQIESRALQKAKNILIERKSLLCQG